MCVQCPKIAISTTSNVYQIRFDFLLKHLLNEILKEKQNNLILATLPHDANPFLLLILALGNFFLSNVLVSALDRPKSSHILGVLGHFFHQFLSLS